MERIDRELLRASRRAWFDHTAPRVGPNWLQWMWTAIFCIALAVPFTVLGSMTFARVSGLGWLELYGRNLGVCSVIGGFIHLVYDVLRWWMGGFERVKHWTKGQRTFFFSGLPLVCTFLAWPVGIALFAPPVLRATARSEGTHIVIGMVLLALLMTFFFHQFFVVKQAQLEAERRAAETQLRLLQGQIEPHFLFNTLAGVISTMDDEPARAKRMLQDFTEVLRSSLGALRTESNPLAAELALAEHYLRLMGSRMEDR
ncbi:MAG: histidine kinase, partial [Rubrivivax sp.]|nr:histidine kinase [Rubrivivax sp.]